MKKKVFVAMSGGVDSSVSAFLLKQQGYDVGGITMAFDGLNGLGAEDAGGNETARAAQKISRILDIPHHVLALRALLEEHVIDNFIAEYSDGRTPNPCARCNRYVKFGQLLKEARALGGDFLATGHYVQNSFDAQRQEYRLHKAKDPWKDQSYFLYTLSQSVLEQVLFPLGELTKVEVRQIAQNNGLGQAAERSESQDICFIPDKGYKKFIHDRKGEEFFKPGEFVNHNGEVVGRHKGIINYTIGQRDKLGLALGVPVYVYKIDKTTNTVYVGPKTCLLSQGLFAEDVCWVGGKSLEGNMDVMARIRYNAPDVPAQVTCLPNNRWRVLFTDPQEAITPGQCVVLYQDDFVLGGGIIDGSIPVEAKIESTDLKKPSQ